MAHWATRPIHLAKLVRASDGGRREVVGGFERSGGRSVAPPKFATWCPRGKGVGVLTRGVNRLGLEVLKSFADRETEKIWNLQHSRRIQPDIQQRALNKLAMISRAASLQDLRVPPSNHLEALKGERSGQFSIRINQQWRICFRWEDGDAHAVAITDYH